MLAEISSHFRSRAPSPIRRAQLLFNERPDRDRVAVVNVAIGNVSRPMHPAMIARLRALGAAGAPFADGVVGYVESAGHPEARRAFLNVIASAGVPTQALSALVTDGGSQAMELMLLGVCGPGAERPLLLLEPAYTNYRDMARRIGAPVLAAGRRLLPDGSFSRLDLGAVAKLAREHRPAALVVIPADNPTGLCMQMDELCALAQLCIDHGMWLVSDEAYRQLQYGGDEVITTIWSLAESELPGITGRRISIESASKVFNACGLRVGALVTDNRELFDRAVAEQTANLSANTLGQHLFGALADLDHAALRAWYVEQRLYYSGLMREVTEGLRRAVPGLLVSRPEAALYAVLDLVEVVPAHFDAAEFVAFCARQGAVDLDGRPHTLLLAPMGGFYAGRPEIRTQLRLACVAPPEQMKLVPLLFRRLLDTYLG